MILGLHSRFHRAIVALMTLTCATACSHVLEVRLFNNTADPIVLHVSVLQGYHSQEKDIVVGSGGLSAPFVYPGGTLHMSTSGCELTYTWPKTMSGYPLAQTSSSDVIVAVQLEPNFGLYLVPPDAQTVSDVELSKRLQVQGFPLRSSRSFATGVAPR